MNRKARERELLSMLPEEQRGLVDPALLSDAELNSLIAAAGHAAKRREEHGDNPRPRRIRR